MRLRNPLEGDIEDFGIVLVVGLGAYLLYKHYTNAAAATAAAAAAAATANSGPVISNANPGDAYFTGGASQFASGAAGL